jgi:hypothetical protein
MISTKNLTPWMHVFNENIHNIHLSWHPNAFIIDYAQGGNQLHQVESLSLPPFYPTSSTI